jgi:hypothetical protein
MFLELDDAEIRLLMVAIRQVEHTFTIAERQSMEAGEPLAADYDDVRQAYERLYQKLSELAGEAGKPYLVK